MVMFHGYVSLPEGIFKYPANQNPGGLSPGLQSIHFGARSFGGVLIGVPWSKHWMNVVWSSHNRNPGNKMAILISTIWLWINTY